MRTLRLDRLAAVLFLAASFWLGAAYVAHAQFTGSATGGPLTISTASSFGPDAPTGHVWLCLPGISVTTIVSWDAGGASGGGVQVLRGLSPHGPFTPIATRLPLAGWTFDTMHLFSTSVYYEVSAGGTPSAPVRVDLPGPSCR